MFWISCVLTTTVANTNIQILTTVDLPVAEVKNALSNAINELIRVKSYN